MVFNLNAQKLNIHYSGGNKKIINAVIEANKIISNTEFYKQIERINSFYNSSYSGLQISTEMKNLTKTVEVLVYWNPFTKSNAKTQNAIKVNTAKLHRDLKSITNTLIHELVHFVDWSVNSKWDYTHKGQAYETIPVSAPYVIGAIAESLIK